MKTVADDFVRALVLKHWDIGEATMSVGHDSNTGHMRFLVETDIDPPSDEIEDRILEELQARYKNAELYMMRYGA